MSNGRFRFWVALGCGLMLGTSGWAAKPLAVASLSTVLSDLGRQIGRDKVRIVDLVRSGVDPHQFEPTPGDVRQVAEADAVLVSGKGLEGYLTKLEQSTGNTGKFIDVGRELPSLQLPEGGKMVPDPHWWHDVGNAETAVSVLANAFAVADPDDQGAFTANAAALRQQLQKLAAELKVKVAELPRDRRKLVTSHDAFQYFARAFGFTVYPIEGVSPTDQPSSKKVAELIDTIRRQNVKAVFFENVENPKVTAEITRETGAIIGGELYADGLGNPGSGAETYQDMMRHNVNTIVNALR
jgi:ABC-type Zn uptake system ZnuABC Zn-binding protein ZnuA